VRRSLWTLGSCKADSTDHRKHFESLKFSILTIQRFAARNAGVGTYVEPCRGRYRSMDTTKRLTYSRTKPEPRVLKCSSALLSTVIALCKSSGCPTLTTTEGVWKYAVMRDSCPSGSSRTSAASACS